MSAPFAFSDMPVGKVEREETGGGRWRKKMREREKKVKGSQGKRAARKDKRIQGDEGGEMK